jgi:uncharacterized membrane protein YphA (DoxX/SURF4 family)
MKIAAIISRYLLGLLFTAFGLNGSLHFIHQPPPANPVALQFMTAVSVPHFMSVVVLVQLIGGVLLLAGRFVPLAIAILAPVLLNILNYHLTMDPGSIGGALVARSSGRFSFCSTGPALQESSRPGRKKVRTIGA